jgi:type IV pilus assembly protein PilA
MPPMPPPVVPRWSGLAIAGFVLSFFCGLLGLILSILGYNECRRSNGTVKGEGLALAGIIISALLGIVGVLAAVAIPAFMDYMQKAKTNEATLQLEKLGRSARMYYLRNASFPNGSSTTLPQGPCCGNPRNKCPVTFDWERDPAWRDLEFQVDEPSYFQYRYEGTTDAFTATATGDLDCDGVTITYTLEGRVVGGSPEVRLIEPPRRAD